MWVNGKMTERKQDDRIGMLSMEWVSLVKQSYQKFLYKEVE